MISAHELSKHLVQNLQLAADINHILISLVEHAVFSQRMFNQVGMVGGLAQVHHTVFEADVGVTANSGFLTVIESSHATQTSIFVLVIFGQLLQEGFVRATSNENLNVEQILQDLSRTMIHAQAPTKALS